MAQGQQAAPPRGRHQTPGVRHLLRQLEPFVPEGPALGEQAQFGVVPGEHGIGEHGGEGGQAVALAAPRPVEDQHGLPVAVDRSTIVPLALIGKAQELGRQRVQDALPAGRGEGEGLLGSGNGLIIGPPGVEMEGQKARDLSQAMRVVEGGRERLGLAQHRQDPLQSAERAERRAQGEAEVDGLLAGRTRLRQMRQSAEGLLDVPHGLPVGRLRHGFLPRLSEVRHGFVPHLAPQRMGGQAFDLLAHVAPIEPLQGRNNAGMEGPPPLLE